MKRLILISMVVTSTFCVFADKTASQNWVSNIVETAKINILEGVNNKVGESLNQMNVPTSTNASNTVTWSNTDLTVKKVQSATIQSAASNPVFKADQTTNGGQLKGTWTLNGTNVITQAELNDATNNLVQTGTKIDPEQVREIAKDAVASNSYNTASYVISNGSIIYTEHPVHVTLNSTSVLTGVGDWPNSKCVFLKVTVAEGSYSKGNSVKVIGYGTLPTQNFLAVMWYLDGLWYINVLTTNPL